jgi:DNA gyrase subunit B
MGIMAEKDNEQSPKKAAKKPEAKEAKKDSNKGSASYSARDIYVLEGLEPVRKRPGMYIGSTGSVGLHHLIWEVVDNSIDEAMAGFAKNIIVELLPDNKVAVTDDGRGIPVDIHAQTKKSALETVLTTLHAGGKFGGESYKVSGGLHGVGVSVVNALSDWTKVEVERDGGMFVQEYERGKPKYKVKKVGTSKRHGTKVTFSPDPQIFSEMGFSDKTILEHLRQQAYLTKGVRISFFDRREKIPVFYGFYFAGGVLSFVKFLAQKKNRLHEDIFYVEKEHEKLDIECAFLYVDDTRMQEMSFANNIYTPEGGMHLTGFRSALTRSLNAFARGEGYLKEKEENLTADDVREGLIVVLSVKLREPQFEGQTKAKLGNPEARTATEAVINEALKEFLEKHPQEAKSIIAKVILTSKARLAAKAARETVLRKGAFEGLTLPGKLADCISKSPADSELFIVEGDSAGGTAKQGRNRHTQAILPLRGKILNVERARLDKMLANAEVRALVVAIGTAIGEEFNMEKLRYHKIVIMTDADVDGAHIRTLLLTLFYRYFKSVVEGGYIYIAQPPLFRVSLGKNFRYVFSEDEREKAVAELKALKPAAKAAKGKKKDATEEVAEAGEGAEAEGEISEEVGTIKRQPGQPNVQRYKGLGEMNAEQLWETTMNPENRLMKQVTIDDAEAADKLFDVLMGDAVEPRKNFIQAHAASVQNLDI